MRKIVVLDGFAANPGDLSYQTLEEWGELTVWDRTAPDELYGRANGAEILLTNKTILNAEMLRRLDSLKYISVLATGWNVVDTAEARRLGIPVSNIPAYSTESVVQMTTAHLLNLASALADHTGAVRAGKWESCADFSFTLSPLTELAGKTFGIIGFGTIGRRVAQVVTALGMNVIAYGPHLTPGEIPGWPKTVRAGTLDELFAVSDAVSLHCPLKEENRGIISAERLAQMKKGAFLINTARGPLIDEEALADALNRGDLAGAGLDVLSAEPPKKENPLLTAKNCFITPHNAWASLEARRRLLNITAENIRGYCTGSLQNVIN